VDAFQVSVIEVDDTGDAASPVGTVGATVSGGAEPWPPEPHPARRSATTPNVRLIIITVLWRNRTVVNLRLEDNVAHRSPSVRWA